MADPCININLDENEKKTNIVNSKNKNTLTKSQLYSKAVRGKLNAQGQTTFSTQNKFGTNPNVYNLQKIPNTNILLFTRNNCS